MIRMDGYGMFTGQAMVTVGLLDNPPELGDGEIIHYFDGTHRYMRTEKELGYAEVTYIFSAEGAKTETITLTQRLQAKIMSLSPTDVSELLSALHTVKVGPNNAGLLAILNADSSKVDVKQMLYDYVTDPTNPGGGTATLDSVPIAQIFEMLTQPAQLVSSKDAQTVGTYNQVTTGWSKLDYVNILDQATQNFFAFLTSNGLIETARLTKYTTKPISLIQIALGLNKTITPEDLMGAVQSQTGAWLI